MEDRELLEAAAKAAGRVYVDGEILDEGAGWNPLDDDGDALRLAVALRINIEHMKTLGGDPFGINCWPIGLGDCGVTEDRDLSDYAASTRRAIVRAAAAMATARSA